ncbi:hypothetical protein ARMGADRAFT_97491 [Armillaria gallica]|uniref:Uncharacterized protein n=1 Tax=Armillaria gallica TaxID=47427 RepID=A0A2H3CA56_ARMGA|nr:hypothetical protein ARMGADRAFT_97491 [Armillaria gallica]
MHLPSLSEPHCRRLTPAQHVHPLLPPTTTVSWRSSATETAVSKTEHSSRATRTVSTVVVVIAIPPALPRLSISCIGDFSTHNGALWSSKRHIDHGAATAGKSCSTRYLPVDGAIDARHAATFQPPNEANRKQHYEFTRRAGIPASKPSSVLALLPHLRAAAISQRQETVAVVKYQQRRRVFKSAPIRLMRKGTSGEERGFGE